MIWKVARKMAVWGDEDDYKESSTLSSSRTHYLTIRGDDFDRLDHGEFLNDTLVDFWMTW